MHKEIRGTTTWEGIMAAKLLMDLTDDELMENYRQTNARTVHGTASFADEFSRRAAERNGKAMEKITRQMLWLTILVTVCTVISTAATIYGVMRH
jgi:hypothetical protein